MEYINFSQKYENQLIRLWNRCLDFDPITKESFERKALFDENYDPELSWLATEYDTVVGFIMATKRKFPYLERGLEPERGWINVIFVDPDFRNCGIGKELYLRAEQELKRRGVKEITLASYSPNYFFGGMDENNYPSASAFFRKQGYAAGNIHYSMSRDLHGYNIPEPVLKKKTELEKDGYTFQHFDYSKSLELLDFLKTEFGGGWKRNALIAMQERKAEDLILIVLDKNDSICGFSMSAIDGNPLRFGPIGIAASKRSEGIGSVLLNYSLYELNRKGISIIFFMTTDEAGRRYYERNGFKIIRSMRDYRKQLI